jgi:predicted nucleic acid-binding Zn ribbon protein
MPWRPLGGGQGEGDPVRLGDSLDRVISRLGPDRAALVELARCWPDIVGVTVAAHSRPSSLTSGVLDIVVREPGWATELRYLEADLKRRVSEALGPGLVTRVTVRVRHG